MNKKQNSMILKKMAIYMLFALLMLVNNVSIAQKMELFSVSGIHAKKGTYYKVPSCC